MGANVAYNYLGEFGWVWGGGWGGPSARESMSVGFGVCAKVRAAWGPPSAIASPSKGRPSRADSGGQSSRAERIPASSNIELGATHLSAPRPEP